MTMSHLVVIFYIKGKNNQKMMMMMMSSGSLSSSSNITIKEFLLLKMTMSRQKTKNIFNNAFSLWWRGRPCQKRKQKYVFENGWCC
jgi:hypothetical protein